jgi:hypothetical protein
MIEPSARLCCACFRIREDGSASLVRLRPRCRTANSLCRRGLGGRLRCRSLSLEWARTVDRRASLDTACGRTVLLVFNLARETYPVGKA